MNDLTDLESLLDDDALDALLDDNDEEGEGEGGGKPPATPAAQAALTDEDKRKIAEEWISKNSGQYRPFGNSESKPNEDDEDDNTVAGVIKKEVKKAISESFGTFRAEMAPQQAAIAAPLIVEAVKQLGNLSDAEVSELRQVVANINPSALPGVLNDTTMQRELAALAKGRAFYNAPATAAPSTRQAGGIKWAGSVTSDDVRKYLLFKGKDKLGKEEIKELTSIGYIVR